MSDEAGAIAPSEGAVASTPLTAASAILAKKRAETPPDTAAAAPTTATPEAPAAPTTPETPTAAAPDPEAEAVERNKRLIADERAKRQAKREREEAEKALAEAKREKEEAASFRSEKAEWEKAIADAKRNPEAFLERTGLTIDDLVRARLEGGVSPELLAKDKDERTAAEIKELRDLVAGLKTEREKERTEAEQRTRAERADQATKQIKSQIAEAVSADPKKYALITKLGEHDEVYKLIEGRYIQSKGEILLTPTEAADMVEKYHRDRARMAVETEALDELIDALPPEKRQALYARLAATSTPAAPDPKAQAGKPAPQAKPTSDARAKQASALTANTVTSPANPADDAPQMLSREDFIKKAAERIRASKKEQAAAKAK